MRQDLLLDWGRGRPLVGGGGEGRGAPGRTSGGCGGAHGLEAGREAGPGFRGPPCPDFGEGDSSLRLACLTRPAAGEARLDRVEGGGRASLPAATISGAALLATAASCSRETQRGLHGSSPEQDCRAGDKAEAPKGLEQSTLETPLDPTEDAPCPTCSSSSDSEPEGFFLGQRLPRPCKAAGSPQAGDSETSKKHCIIC